MDRPLLSIDMALSILIVEDDALIRSWMLALMKINGVTASAVGTLADARRQFAALSTTHVILDLNLPDGLGIELLSSIRSAGLPTRVLVLSGSSDQSMRDQVSKLGVDHVLTKPPDWDLVVAWGKSEASVFR